MSTAARSGTGAVRPSLRFLDRVLRAQKDKTFIIHFDFETELLQDLTANRAQTWNTRSISWNFPPPAVRRCGAPEEAAAIREEEAAGRSGGGHHAL